MSEILSNTGVKLWSETDYNELWLTIFDQLTGQGGKSNIRLIDEAIGKINVALDGYKFEFSSDEDRLYISKGDSKLPVSLIDSNGHVATKVDGTTITIDESGVIKGVPVDDALSEESTNPLQNKVIAGELKSIKSKMGTDESAIKQNTSDITSNTKRIEANETAISTLNGTGDGSVKKAVSDGIAEVVAGAPEDFDTLKEMSDWISTHETSASAMNSQIQDNKKAITTLQTDKADKTEIPTVPTNVSEFTNDAGYLTEHQDISNLVVKEEGKGLSSNDYTSEEKTKLGGVGTSQGQNLITYPYYRPDSYTTNGITWTVNEDGSITANGTATATAFYCVFKGQLGLEIGKYYVLTLTTVKGKAALYLANENKQNHGTDIAACRDVNDSTLERIFKYSQTDDFDHDVIGLYITTGTTLTNCVIKFQLECGTIRHEYQPTTLSNPTLKKKITDIRSETTVNLLKPTLETITENGVTCTNNGDGTYTLNGTATSTVRFQFGIDDNLIVGKTYKALGIPIAGSYSTILMGWDNHGYFNKDGLIDKKTSEPRPISMQVLSGYTCDNLVFKPMLTTNLSATYDDFVPYTGDAGKLNGDVAELNKTVDTLKKSVSDGKTKVANAITGKGVETATDATFDVMAENIGKIDTELHGATLAVSTSDNELFGKTVTLTLNRANVGTTVLASNGTCSFVVQTPGTYTITSGEAHKDVTVTSDNVLNKTVISVELSLLKIVAFATGTDAEIAAMIKAHYNNKINIADYWAVGDIRTVHLSAMAAIHVGESHRAQDVQFVIGDFEHDDLRTPINGHSKAAVTLLQKDCLMDAANASNPVNGSEDTERGYINELGTTAGGWNECPRRAWCNNTYFTALPTIWQSMVKSVKKKASGGNTQTSIDITIDKVFLAAEIEIFGLTKYSAPGEGTQYQYYKNATANRYKLPRFSSDSGSVTSSYYERSPSVRSISEFCILDRMGGANTEYANDRRAIAPCLCI